MFTIASAQVKPATIETTKKVELQLASLQADDCGLSQIIIYFIKCPAKRGILYLLLLRPGFNRVSFAWIGARKGQGVSNGMPVFSHAVSLHTYKAWLGRHDLEVS